MKAKQNAVKPGQEVTPLRHLHYLSLSVANSRLVDKGFPLFGKLVALSVLSCCLLTGVFNPAEASRRSAISRLQHQQAATQIFMPAQLTVGQTAKFQCRAPQGTLVRVYYAARPLTLPTLNEKIPFIQGEVPASGVLVLDFPVPEEATLAGQTVHLLSVTVDPTNPNELNYEVEWREASGRLTSSPSLYIAEAVAVKEGPRIMPLMPGMDPNLMRDLETTTDLATTKNKRKKQLIDDGSINRDRQIDRNALILSPGN